jgi:chromosome segregation ATPase
MADHARVTDIDALDNFAADLKIIAEDLAETADFSRQNLEDLFRRAERQMHTWRREEDEIHDEIAAAAAELAACGPVQTARVIPQSKLRQAKKRLEEIEMKARSLRSLMASWDEETRRPMSALLRLHSIATDDLEQARNQLRNAAISLRRYSEGGPS